MKKILGCIRYLMLVYLCIYLFASLIFQYGTLIQFVDIEGDERGGVMENEELAFGECGT
jgi:hypothetical protein